MKLTSVLLRSGAWHRPQVSSPSLTDRQDEGDRLLSQRKARVFSHLIKTMRFLLHSSLKQICWSDMIKNYSEMNVMSQCLWCNWWLEFVHHDSGLGAFYAVLCRHAAGSTWSWVMPPRGLTFVAHTVWGFKTLVWHTAIFWLLPWRDSHFFPSCEVCAQVQ